MAQRPNLSGIKLKRVYAPASRSDGVRVLIDRLWPRGLSKAQAAIDRWCKEAAPSTKLRKWFGHRPERWEEFRKRYRTELAQHQKSLDEIRDLAKKGPITLLFGAHDEMQNNAVVLRELLLGKRFTRKTSGKGAGKPRRKT